MSNFYYAEPTLGLVIVEKTGQGQVAKTGIADIDNNVSNSIRLGNKCSQVDPEACQGIPDLQNLTIPSSDNIFHNIRVRYYKDQIYTECGERILIVVNPHKPLFIYDELLRQYKLSKQQDKLPHIYKITQSAVEEIFKASNVHKSSTLLLTGESGAGKTVSTKHVLNYIAKESKSGLYQSVVAMDKVPIDVSITQTNILFEALGNAQTSKNKNSSRFGKVVSIQFNSNKQVKSCRVQTWLFEKIRLTKLNQNDRNYHIFYQLVAGYKSRHLLSDLKTNFPDLKLESDNLDLSDVIQNLEKLHLDGDYQMLGDSQPTKADLLDFIALCDSLDQLQFDPDQVTCIFEIIAGLLHLGGLIESSNSQQSYDAELKYAEQLLQIPNLSTQFDDDTLKSMSFSKRVEAESVIEGFIVHVYSQLFELIVKKVNFALSSDFNPENGYVLNVFDGFGFETIENENGVQQNHLEQMVLNYTNEKLQNFFFDSVVKHEQAPYIQEGIDWKVINFETNDLLIKLFDDVIFPSLNDCTQVGASYQNVVSKIQKACPTQQLRKTTRSSIGLQKQLSDLLIYQEDLQQAKMSLTQSQLAHQHEKKILGIRHSNGEVYYRLPDFLERNKFAISEQMQRLTEKSQNPILKELTPNKQNITVVQNAQQQLKKLLEQFNKSVSFCVKCILPNNQNKPRNFQGPAVLQQLSESGIQQAAQLLTETYQCQIPIPEFFKKYNLICKQAKQQRVLNVELLKQFLQQSKEYQHLIASDMIQFGTNIVFMKQSVKNLLDSKQKKIVSDFIVWGVKHWKNRLLRRKRNQRQVAPQQTEQQEQAPVQQRQTSQQQYSYEELQAQNQNLEAQLAIFQELYRKEVAKNQANNDDGQNMKLQESMDRKLDLLLQYAGQQFRQQDPQNQQNQQFQNDQY